MTVRFDCAQRPDVIAPRHLGQRILDHDEHSEQLGTDVRILEDPAANVETGECRISVGEQGEVHTERAEPQAGPPVQDSAAPVTPTAKSGKTPACD